MLTEKEFIKKYDNVEAVWYTTDNETIKSEIEKLEAKFSGDGRVLIRPSGTEPIVRVMIEGRDQQIIQQEAERLAKLIEGLLN